MTSQQPDAWRRRIRAACRRRHLSARTEKAYAGWVARYIAHFRYEHPAQLGKECISRFLTHLAVEHGVAPSTQNQARSALVFLYRHVLEIPLDRIAPYRLASKPRSLPTLPGARGVQSMLAHLRGECRLIARLLYEAGLRPGEAIRLRVRDVDVSERRIHIHDARGRLNRSIALPDGLYEPMRRQLEKARILHEEDLEAGLGATPIPSYVKIHTPDAATHWEWQFVFPSPVLRTDRETGVTIRQHVSESFVRKAVQTAWRDSATGGTGCSSLRHNYALRLIQKGVDSRRLGKLMGYKDNRAARILRAAYMVQRTKSRFR